MVVDSSLGLGGMVEDILLGLLCCKTNDAMSIFLLPVVVHVKERKGEERLWWLVACGWSSSGGRLLYEGSFYGKSKIMKRPNMLGFYMGSIL